jgi:GT2 family glycosyltransferase
MDRPPHVGIILVNWNGLSDTLECVRSCLRLDGPRFRIVIVDNGSSDGSCQTLAASFAADPRITLLSARGNLGFAGGNNRGIAWALDAGADFVWLLNNDTIVNPTTLRALVDAASTHSRAGIFGSKIHFRDRPDTIWFAGGFIQARGHHYSRHRGMGEVDRGQYDRVEEMEFITGCSLLVRAATLRDIRRMTEDYFLYWEDVDWCTRARLAGWQCLYVPQSTLMHKVGATANRQPEMQRRYETRNRLLYQWRFNRPGAVEALAFLLAGTIRSYLGGDRHSFRAPLAGACDFLTGRTGRLEP